MTLLRKYYSPGIEGGGIPDEVIKMLEEKFRLPTEKELGDFESIEDAVSHMATQNLCFAMSKYGYSLAFEELARLKEENERLRGAMAELMEQYKIEVENDLKLGENIDEWVSDLPTYQKCLELLTPSPTKK